MFVIPPFAKCAKDGAPGDGWLLVENKQRQVQLQLCGYEQLFIPPIAKCLMDGPPGKDL